MKNDSWGLALRIMARISGWIAFPVLLGVFLGKWLDRRFDTEPFLFIITVAVCFVISMYGLVINALKEFKKIEDESKAEKKLQTEKVETESQKK
ncbi:MAG: AtpZ/AtpI family protein [Patescibacteria group bacterium]|jgi:F0F1-type ATP synthase assembly protein I